VKVTIAKSLVSSVQNVKTYLDENQLDVAITEDADSWLLSFTYMHSTHKVMISLATNAATTTFLDIENWIWVSVVIIIVMIGAGLLVYFETRFCSE
jgi:glycerol kinase